MNGDVLSSVRMSGFADASLGDDPGSRAARVGTIVLVNGGFVCGKSSKFEEARADIKCRCRVAWAVGVCA